MAFPGCKIVIRAISTKHPQNPPTIVIFSVILPTWQCSIKSTQIALTWETFKLILHVSDMKPRASQTLHEVKVSDILEEEREGFRRSEALQFIKEWIDVTMLEDQLLVAKTGAGECESKGRRVLAATTEGEYHYWGHQSLLRRRRDRWLCRSLHSSVLQRPRHWVQPQLQEKYKEAPQKYNKAQHLRAMTRISTMAAHCLGALHMSQFLQDGKNPCLILTYFNQGGQMCPHPKHANTYTRKNQWVKFW